MVGRESTKSLFSEEHSTFEEDEVYNQKDAEGFIRLNAFFFDKMFHISVLTSILPLKL